MSSVVHTVAKFQANPGYVNGMSFRNVCNVAILFTLFLNNSLKTKAKPLAAPNISASRFSLFLSLR